MKKAAESAAKWLASKVQSNPKLNPIPFGLFKAILEKQVTWARTQRGIYISFDELAENVRAELLKSNITVLPENVKKIGTVKSENDHTNALIVNFKSSGEAVCFSLLFEWLCQVFTRASEGKCSGVQIDAKMLKEERL